MCAGAEEGAVTATDRCSGLCFNICQHETTAVTWSFWWDVWTFCSNVSGDNPGIFKETTGQFPAVLVQTKPDNIWMFSSCWSGCFWLDDGTFSDVFFIFLTDVFDKKLSCFTAVLVKTNRLFPAVFRATEPGEPQHDLFLSSVVHVTKTTCWKIEESSR